MNREQRRAQLRELKKKFTGIDVSSGELEVPIVGSEEVLRVDLYDFGTTKHLMRMCDLFLNMREHRKEAFEAMEAETDAFRKDLMFSDIYEGVVKEFAGHVDAVFGEGAMLKIFGNVEPVPAPIVEFVKCVAPIVQAAASVMSGELHSAEDNAALKTAAAATAAAGREGNV